MSTFTKDLADKDYFLPIERNTNNPYLNLSGIDDVVSNGLHSFYIHGSDYLLRGSEILFEIIDSEGNPVSIAGVRNLLSGNSRVVSFEIDKDIKEGEATLYIAAVLNEYSDENGERILVPEDWFNIPNFLFEFKFIINKSLPNTDDVVFRKTPQIEVTPVIKEAVVVQKDTIQVGSNTIYDYSNFTYTGSLQQNSNSYKNVNGTILSVAKDDTGYVVVGDLDDYKNNVFKLDANGDIDDSIIFPRIRGGVVRDVAYEEVSGDYFFVGDFDTVDDIEYNKFIRVTSNGLLDLSVDDVNITGSVNKVIPINSDDTIILGDFNSIAGVPYSGSAIIDRNGAVTQSFVDPGISGSVYDGLYVETQTDKFIYVVGEFTEVGGFEYGSVARLNIDGTVDTTFQNPDVNGRVNVIKQLPGGSFIIGGDFTKVGNALYSGSVVLDDDGTINTSYQIQNIDGSVNDIIVVDDDGDYAVIYGGDFTVTYGTNSYKSFYKTSLTGNFDSTFIDNKVIGSINKLIDSPENSEIFVFGDYEMDDYNSHKFGEIIEAKRNFFKEWVITFEATSDVFIGDMKGGVVYFETRDEGDGRTFSYIDHKDYPTPRGYRGIVKTIINRRTVELRVNNPDINKFTDDSLKPFTSTFIPEGKRIKFFVEYVSDVLDLKRDLQENAIADVLLKDIETVSGDLEYVRISTKSDTIGETVYSVKSTSKLDLQKSLLNITDNLDIGRFTRPDKLAYWSASISTNTNSLADPAPPVIALDDEFLVGGMSITGATIDDIIYTDIPGKPLLQQPLYRIETDTSFTLNADIKYRIRLDAQVRNVPYPDTRLDVYVSGSNLPAGCSNRYGTLVHSFRADSDQTWLDRFDIIYERDVNVTNARLVFVVTGGDWSIRDVRIAPDNEFGYSPFEFRTSFPVTVVRDRQDFDFRVEFFNGKGQKVQEEIYLDNVRFDRPNLVISGVRNYLSGSLVMGGSPFDAEIEGSTISSDGYKGFNETLLGIGEPGFLIWKGSILTEYTRYNGVGIELVANDNNFFRFGTDPSRLEIATDSFFVGDINTQFLSGSDGNIEISSSFFHLKPDEKELVIQGGVIKSRPGNTLDDGIGYYLSEQGLRIGDEFESIRYKVDEGLTLTNVDFTVTSNGLYRAYESALAPKFIFSQASDVFVTTPERNTIFTLLNQETSASFVDFTGPAYSSFLLESLLIFTSSAYTFDSDRPSSIVDYDAGFQLPGTNQASNLFYLKDPSRVYVFNTEQIANVQLFGTNTNNGQFSSIDSYAIASNANFEIPSSDLTGYTYFKLISDSPVVVFQQDFNGYRVVNPPSKEVYHGAGTEIEIIQPTPDAIIQTNGNTVVVGDFTEVGEELIDNYVRILSDGARDTYQLVKNINGPIYDSEFYEDGTILLVGEFTVYGGEFYRRAVKILPNGVIDEQFKNTRIDGPVYVVKYIGNDRMILGGSFTSVNNIPMSGSVILEPNGEIYDDWTDPNINGTVYDILVESPTSYIAVGDFNLANNNEYSGSVRLRKDGRFTTSFRNPRIEGTPYSIAKDSFGDIYIAGDITKIDIEPVSNIAKFSTRGQFDDTFITEEFNGQINSIAVDPNDDIIAVGKFTEYGPFVYSGSLKLSGSGEIITDYISPGFITSFNNAFDSVEDVIIDGDTYVMAGYFSITTASANYIEPSSARYTNIVAVDITGSVSSSISFDGTNGIVYSINKNENAPYVNGYYRSEEPFQLVSKEYGEYGIPSQMLGDTYNIPFSRSIDLDIITTEPGTIKVQYFYEDGFEFNVSKFVFDSVGNLSFPLQDASKDNPRIVSTGASTKVPGVDSVRLTSDVTFAVRIKDVESIYGTKKNAYHATGYRKRFRGPYSIGSIISADRVRTGQIISQNWNGIKSDGSGSWTDLDGKPVSGSMFDLNIGSMYLKDTFIWDGKKDTLNISGSDVYIETPKWFLGFDAKTTEDPDDRGSFVSGSDGELEISSSLFHLRTVDGTLIFRQPVKIDRDGNPYSDYIPRGFWEPGIEYFVNDIVQYNIGEGIVNSYVCLFDHTSAESDPNGPPEPDNPLLNNIESPFGEGNWRLFAGGFDTFTTVDLFANSTTILYDRTGNLISPEILTITASVQNFDDPYFKFTSDDQTFFTDESSFTSGSGSFDFLEIVPPATSFIRPVTIRVGVSENGPLVENEKAFDFITLTPLRDGADSNPFYFINAPQGRVIKNSDPNATLRARAAKVTREDDPSDDGITFLNNGDIKLYIGPVSGSQWLEGLTGTFDESADYDLSFNAVKIPSNGPRTVTLKSGSIVYDSIDFVDLTDGNGGAVIEAPAGLVINWISEGNGPFSPGRYNKEFLPLTAVFYAPGGDDTAVSASIEVYPSRSIFTDYMYYEVLENGNPSITFELTDGDRVKFDGPGSGSALPTTDVVVKATYKDPIVRNAPTQSVYETVYIASNGLDGLNAIYVSNPNGNVDVLADQYGRVAEGPSTDPYARTGTIISVFEGIEQLQYVDDISLVENATWTFSSVELSEIGALKTGSITVGGDEGKDAVVGPISEFLDLSEFVQIAYNITGSRENGYPFKARTVQNINKKSQIAAAYGVSLTSPRYVIDYDRVGNLLSPAVVEITASSINFVDPFFKFTQLSGPDLGISETEFTAGTLFDNEGDGISFIPASTYSDETISIRVEVSEGTFFGLSQDQSEIVRASDVINIITVKPGSDNDPFYYIQPQDGTAIKNSGTQTLEFRIASIVSDQYGYVTSGDLAIAKYSSGDNTKLVNYTILNASQTGIFDTLGTDARYRPTIDKDGIDNGNLTLYLIDAADSENVRIVDTVKLFDITDGVMGGYFVSPNGLNLRRDKLPSGVYADTYTPSSLSLKAVFYGANDDGSSNLIEYTQSFAIDAQVIGVTDYMRYVLTEDQPAITLSVTDGDGLDVIENDFTASKDLVVTATFVDPVANNTISMVETFYIISDGLDGIDAIKVENSNPTQQITANEYGANEDFSKTEITMSVFEGNQRLSYSSTLGAVTPSWTITSVTEDPAGVSNDRSNFYADQFDGQDFVFYPDITSLNADKVTYTFNISGKRKTGENFTTSTTQVLTRSQTGAASKIAVINLTPNVVQYDRNGFNPNPSQVTVTVRTNNFTDPIFKITNDGGLVGDDTDYNPSNVLGGVDYQKTYDLPSIIPSSPVVFTADVSSSSQPESDISTTTLAFIKPGADTDPIYQIATINSSNVLSDAAGINARIEIQLQRVTSTGVENVSDGDVKLYSGSIPLSGFSTLENGTIVTDNKDYNAKFDRSDIKGYTLIEAKSGSLENGFTVYDTIGLADISDGISTGWIVPSNLNLIREDDGSYSPATSSLDINFIGRFEGSIYTASVDVYGYYSASQLTDYMYYELGDANDPSITIVADDVDGTTYLGTGFSNKLPTKNITITAKFNDPGRTTSDLISISETVNISSDGKDGLDSIFANYTNPIVILRENAEGVIELGQYFNSGTTIELFEGSRKLTPVDKDTDLENLQWKISSIILVPDTVPVALETGSVSFDEDAYTITDHSNLSESIDNVNINYNIDFQRFDGTSGQTTVQQKIIRAIQGTPGTDGPGLIFVGPWKTIEEGGLYYYDDNRRDIVTYSGLYYSLQNKRAINDSFNTQNPPNNDPDNEWIQFADFAAVATDLFFADQAYVNEILNIGTSGSSTPVISLDPDKNGGYSNPNISFNGSTYGSDGIFLGYDNNIPKFSLSGSSRGIFWDGSELKIKGALRVTENDETISDYIDRGEWAPEIDYNVDDLVQYESFGLISTYVCTFAHTSTNGTGDTGFPNQSAYWKVFASSAEVPTLFADAFSFVEQEDGTRTPAFIELQMFRRNTTEGVTWTTSSINPLALRSGTQSDDPIQTGQDIVYLHVGDFIGVVNQDQTNSVKITATDDRTNISDSVTITYDKINSSAVVFQLTNESHTITVNEDGTVEPENFIGSSTGMIVKQGNILLNYSGSGAIQESDGNGSWRLKSVVTSSVSYVDDTVISGQIGNNQVVTNNLDEFTADIGTVTFNVEYKTLNGDIIGLVEKQQSFAKSYTGLAGRTIELSATTRSFAYENDILVSENTESIITATPRGARGTPKYKFYLNEQEVSATPADSNTYTYTAQQNLSDMPDKVRVELREGEDTKVWAENEIEIIGIDVASDAYSVFLSRPEVTIQAEADGTVIEGGYTNSGTEISVLKGTQNLTFTTDFPGAGEFSIRITANADIDEGSTPDIDFSQIGNTIYTVGDHSNMTVDQVVLNYAIFAESDELLVNKTQTLTKLRAGADGTPGPGVVFRGEWEVGKVYTKNDARIDVVISASDYFYALQTHQADSTNKPPVDPVTENDYWKTFGQQFSSVATDILLAQNATITKGLVMGADDGGSSFIRSAGAGFDGEYGGYIGEGFYLSSSGEFWFGSGSRFVLWDGEELRIQGALQVTEEGDEIVIYNPRGEWQVGQTYEVRDTVTFVVNGISREYNCIERVALSTDDSSDDGYPNTSAKWEIFRDAVGSPRLYTNTNQFFKNELGSFNPTYIQLQMTKLDENASVTWTSSSLNDVPLPHIPLKISSNAPSTEQNGEDVVYLFAEDFETGLPEGEIAIQISATTETVTDSEIIFLTEENSELVFFDLENADHTVQTDEYGIPINFIGSSATLTVYEGNTKLIYSGTGTLQPTDQPGSWRLINATPAGVGYEVEAVTGQIGETTVTTNEINSFEPDNGEVSFTIQYKKTNNVTGNLTKTQLFKKNNRGSTARSVNLEVDPRIIIYDNDKSIQPSQLPISITASAVNILKQAYYRFLDENDTQIFPTLPAVSSSVNTFTFNDIPSTFPTDGRNELLKKIKVELYDGAGDTTIRSRDSVEIRGIRANVDGTAYYTLLENQYPIVSADSNGDVTDYTGTGTLIQAYKNTDQLEFTTNPNPTLGQFSASIISFSDITTPGSITDLGVNAQVGNHNGMTGGLETTSATVTYRIYYEGITFTDISQKITKNFQGDKGDPGPGLVFRGTWTEGDTYTADGVRTDVVKYTNGSYYYAKQTHTAIDSPDPNANHPTSANSNDYWGLFDQFTAVATDLLLAENVTIKKGLVMGADDEGSSFIRTAAASYNTSNEPTGTGFYLSSSGDFWFGDTSGNNVQWDGTTLTIKGALRQTTNGDDIPDYNLLNAFWSPGVQYFKYDVVKYTVNNTVRLYYSTQLHTSTNDSTITGPPNTIPNNYWELYRDSDRNPQLYFSTNSFNEDENGAVNPLYIQIQMTTYTPGSTVTWEVLDSSESSLGNILRVGTDITDALQNGQDVVYLHASDFANIIGSNNYIEIKATDNSSGVFDREFIYFDRNTPGNILVQLGNANALIPTDEDGGSEDFSLTSTSIVVKEGGTNLVYSGSGDIQETDDPGSWRLFNINETDVSYVNNTAISGQVGNTSVNTNLLDEISAENGSVDFIIKVKKKNGQTITIEEDITQNFSKNRTGASSKTVKLNAPEGSSFVYSNDGTTIVGSNTRILQASSQNVATPHYRFINGSTELKSKSTDSSYEYTASTPFPSSDSTIFQLNLDTITVELYASAESTTVLDTDTLTFQASRQNSNGIAYTLSMDNQYPQVQASLDGTVTNAELAAKTAAEIQVRKNGTLLSYTTQAPPADGQFNVAVDTNVNIDAGSVSGTAEGASVGTHTNMTGGTDVTAASITYEIFCEDSSNPLYITQQITKNFAAEAGPAGPGVVFRGEWKDNVQYIKSDVRVDVVIWPLDDTYYLATETHISQLDINDPSIEGSPWQEFGQQFESVATDILLAQTANINEGLVIGESGFIRSTNASYGGNTPTGNGFFMTASGDFWFGNASGNNVYWDGSNVRVTGSIFTTEGSVGGYTISDGQLFVDDGRLRLYEYERSLLTADDKVTGDGFSGIYLTDSRNSLTNYFGVVDELGGIIPSETAFSVFRMGSSGKYIKFDGQNMSADFGNLTIAKNGTLTITGSIEASSGKIAGDLDVNGGNIRLLSADGTVPTYGSIDLIRESDLAVVGRIFHLEPETGVSAVYFNSTDTLSITATDTLSLSGLFTNIQGGTSGIDITSDGDITLASVSSIKIDSGVSATSETGSLILNDDGTIGVNYDIGVDVSSFMANGADNRVITATGADAMRAETNLTYDGSKLYVGGNIEATGEVTAYASDIRLKDNISEITEPLYKLSKIRGVYFDWNDLAEKEGLPVKNKHDIGVIAQEVNKILPEVVRNAPFDEKYLTVKYEKITPLLIEANKELHSIVKKQQIELDKLKLMVDRLIDKFDKT